MRTDAIGLLLASAGFAGPPGTITGQVVDAGTREGLAGECVVVSGLDLGAAADAAGRFTISRVPAGTWSVEASIVGCRTQMRGAIVVNAGHASEIEFRLTVERTALTEVIFRSERFPKVKDAPVPERSFSAEEIMVALGGNGEI